MVVTPWGRAATLALSVIALVAGQLAALLALSQWFGIGLARIPDFTGDGVAVSLLVFVSTPVEVLLLVWFATRRGGDPLAYLGLSWPKRGDVWFGIAAIAALIAAGDAITWLFGRAVVTPFQSDIYRTASAAGWLPVLLFAIVVITPIGEETLFRGFLFRGLQKSPGDAWMAIVVTALLWAIIHVQYDYFVIAQVFASGLLLGWLRWASGSILLTMLLHGLVNLEGMLETVIGAHT